MNIEITPEVLATQLGYSVSDATINQAKAIIENTKGFDKFSKHVLTLIDSLAHINAYVAMSNSNNYLKVKIQPNDSMEIMDKFKEILEHFSNKYNIVLQKVDNKDVYYIIGIKE
ncbi:MAG: hypothetical protein GX118_08690 [Arcobacter butzleri]|jgi:uncharacterized protein YerC|nr:hypothetical protein [Arcobacteraceae bacterium]MDY0364834.1 hypothetical protein [Arcobacteraceae bacterium]NLO18244.1 hypothetical protein [Aliarcobacter butzleri]